MFQKKKRKNGYRRKQRFLKYVFLLSVLVFILSAVAFISFGILSNEFRFDYTVEYSGEQAKTAIEEHLQTSLLPSVSNQRFFYTSWQEFFMRLRFDIPAIDGKKFLKSIDHLCFEQPLLRGTFGYTPTSEIDWWITRNPQDNSDYLWGANACGNNPYWHIIVDQSNNELWTVYIEAWSA
jgi:hypothetical protein